MSNLYTGNKSGKFYVQTENGLYPVWNEGSKAFESGYTMTASAASERKNSDLAAIGRAAKHVGQDKVAYAWSGVLNSLGHLGNVRPAWSPVTDENMTNYTFVCQV